MYSCWCMVYPIGVCTYIVVGVCTYIVVGVLKENPLQIIVSKWFSWLFQLAFISWVESQVSHDFIPMFDVLNLSVY